MEIMEEGNLIDRIRILLQRDLSHYNSKHSVILQNLCPSSIGGFLDFPSVTTFVAAKIVTWWEESFHLLFHTHSSIFLGNMNINVKIMDENEIMSLNKAITPKDFITLISESCEMILAHVNILTQEALDHADLSVLTGVIGGVSLIRNTIWIYNSCLQKIDPRASLLKDLQNYQSMSDELSERLLDLHCRLISLYILQDADCLDWSAQQAFHEGERSSYTIQMWWFYIQGVREDLWTSISPKAATQIFSGILNESLTILTARYMQADPSTQRNDLIIADISNILLCTFNLLPAIVKHADELFGYKIETNRLHDIHEKCNLLLKFLVIRGIPLNALHELMKQEFKDLKCLTKNENCIQPWIIFAMQEKGENILGNTRHINEVDEYLNLKYEFLISISQVQPSWAHFMSVLRMKNCYILYELFNTTIESEVHRKDEENESSNIMCEGFLCKGMCVTERNIQSAIIHFLIAIDNKHDIENVLIKVLEKTFNQWTLYFTKSQIWNQNRPQWIQTLISEIDPIIQYVLRIVNEEKILDGTFVATYKHYLEYSKETINLIPQGVTTICSLIDNILPTDTICIENSSLMQLITMSLYDKLGNEMELVDMISDTRGKTPEVQKSPKRNKNNTSHNLSYMNNDVINEILIHHVMANVNSRKSMKNLHRELKYNEHNWLRNKLGIGMKIYSNNLIHQMYFIGDTEYDQVLHRKWIPKWKELMNLPLEYTMEELKKYTLQRVEFNSPDQLSQSEQHIISDLKRICKS